MPKYKLNEQVGFKNDKGIIMGVVVAIRLPVNCTEWVYGVEFTWAAADSEGRQKRFDGYYIVYENEIIPLTTNA